MTIRKIESCPPRGYVDGPQTWDSGLRVEVLSGLTEDDQVIAQITPSITEGTIVRTEPAKAEEKKSPND